MKLILNKIFIYSVFLTLFGMIGCAKDETKLVASSGDASMLSASKTSIILKIEDANEDAITFSWTKADFDYTAAINYTLEIDTLGNNFASAKEYTFNPDDSTKTFTVAELNSITYSFDLPAGKASSLIARIKAEISSDVDAAYSTPITLTVTPYNAVLVFPALLVNGGNSWKTPTTRTDGFLLTSSNYDNNYEGYVYLPNADGYGGDAFKLTATTDEKVYGWGSNATTMSVGGGNLWLTVAPNYMKVKVDVSALTINYTAVKFFITGDDNGWSTSATPMLYDATTKTLVANNVSLTAGKKFAFTSNGNYDISYKVDDSGKLIFAGPPSWAGNNISVEKTGVYKVTLDLSAGSGNYKYSIE